jgi:hypothetical protein
MPEWYLVNAALLIVGLLGLTWTPLLAAFPLLLVTAGAPLAQAVTSAFSANFPTKPLSSREVWKRRILTAALHGLQPLARLYGRLSYGLTPWRVKLSPRLVWPRRRELGFWNEKWRSPEDQLQALQTALQAGGASVQIGGEFDRWDLRVRGGLFGEAKVLMAVEDHAGGRQLIRLDLRRRRGVAGALLALLFGALAAAALESNAILAGGVLWALAAAIYLRGALDQSIALSTILEAAARFQERQGLVPVPEERR